MTQNRPNLFIGFDSTDTSPLKPRHSNYACQTMLCSSHAETHDLCILRPTSAMLEFGLEVLQRRDMTTWAVSDGSADYDLERLARYISALEEAQQLVALADAGATRPAKAT